MNVTLESKYNVKDKVVFYVSNSSREVVYGEITLISWDNIEKEFVYNIKIDFHEYQRVSYQDHRTEFLHAERYGDVEYKYMINYVPESYIAIKIE